MDSLLVRDHHSESIRVMSRSCQDCLPPAIRESVYSQNTEGHSLMLSGWEFDR